MTQLLVLLILLSTHGYVGCRMTRSLAEAIVVATLSMLSVIVLAGVTLGTLGFLNALTWTTLTLCFSAGLTLAAGAYGAQGSRERIRYPGHLSMLLSIVPVTLVTITAIKVLISDPANPDDLEYHYPKIFNFIQSESFKRTGLELVDGYPQNGELISTFAYHITNSLALIDGVQLLLIPLFCASISLLASSLGVSQRASFASAILGCCVPAVWSLIPTMHVDFLAASLLVTAVAILFSVKQFDSISKQLLFGAALGLLVGTKFVALPWVAVLLIALLLSPLRPRSVAQTLLVGLPVILLGGERYASNMFREGNPLYPYTIPALGLSIPLHPRLLGTLWEERMTVGIPYMQKVLTSWFSLDSMAQSNHEHWFGGFGLMWPLLLIGTCCALALSARHRSWAIVRLGTLTAVLFVVTPANYTTRFVLFLPAFAAVGFGYLLDSLKNSRWELARSLTVSLAFLAAVHCVRQSITLFVKEVGPRRGSTIFESCKNVAVPLVLAKFMNSPQHEVFRSAKSVSVLLGDLPDERMISYACIWVLHPHLQPTFHDVSAFGKVVATLPDGDSLVVISSQAPPPLSTESAKSEVLLEEKDLQILRVTKPA